MKKIIIGIALLLVLNSEAVADICYDVDEKVSAKAVSLIQNQKEIYRYCSICSEAEAEVIQVKNIKPGNPVSVDDKELDLAHTYYKENGKFINLGISSGCIKDGEYNVKAELDELPNKQTAEINYHQISMQQAQDIFDKCSNTAKSEKFTIPEIEKQNQKIVDCLAEAIKTEIKKGFRDSQQVKMLSYLEQVRKSVFDFYYGISAESKYCSGECRIMPSIQPYADEGKVLLDMLEHLLYINNVKDGD